MIGGRVANRFVESSRAELHFKNLTYFFTLFTFTFTLLCIMFFFILKKSYICSDPR
jgi:hypothetical protein